MARYLCSRDRHSDMDSQDNPNDPVEDAVSEEDPESSGGMDDVDEGNSDEQSGEKTDPEEASEILRYVYAGVPLFLLSSVLLIGFTSLNWLGYISLAIGLLMFVYLVFNYVVMNVFNYAARSTLPDDQDIEGDEEQVSGEDTDEE